MCTHLAQAIQPSLGLYSYTHPAQCTHKRTLKRVNFGRAQQTQTHLQPFPRPEGFQKSKDDIIDWLSKVGACAVSMPVIDCSQVSTMSTGNSEEEDIIVVPGKSPSNASH